MAKKDKIEDVQEVQDVTTEVKESKLPKIRKVKNPKDVVEVVKEKKERKPREKKEKEAEKEVVDDSEMPPGIYFSEVPSEVSLEEAVDKVLGLNEEIVTEFIELSPQAEKWKKWLSLHGSTPERFVEKYPKHPALKYVEELLKK